LPTFTNDGYSQGELDINTELTAFDTRKGFLYIPYDNGGLPPIYYQLSIESFMNQTTNVLSYTNTSIPYSASIARNHFFSYSNLYLKDFFSEDLISFSYMFIGDSTFNTRITALTTPAWISSQYTYPRPVPGMLIMNAYPTGNFQKKYTLVPTTPYTPDTTVGIYGSFTNNIDLITDVQIETSELYFSDPINIQKIDYIGGIDVNRATAFPTQADYLHSEFDETIGNYYLVFKIRKISTSDITYHIVESDNFYITDVTSKVTADDLTGIRTISTRNLKNLDNLNEFFEDKNSGDHEISFGIFFHAPNYSLLTGRKAIFQFYGMSIYMEFNDNTLYKEIDWAYYDQINDIITDTSSVSTDTVIIVPTIASWLMVEEDGIAESQPSNSLAFDTDKIFVFPYPNETLFAGGNWILS